MIRPGRPGRRRSGRPRDRRCRRGTGSARACRPAARSRAGRRRRNSRPRRRCRAARPPRSRTAGRSGRRDNIRPRRAAAARRAATVEQRPRSASAAVRSAISAKRAIAPPPPGLHRLERQRRARRRTAVLCRFRLSSLSANSFRRTSPPMPCAPATAARVTWRSGQGLFGLLGAFLGSRFVGAFGRRLGGLALVGRLVGGRRLLGGSFLGGRPRRRLPRPELLPQRQPPRRRASSAGAASSAAASSAGAASSAAASSAGSLFGRSRLLSRSFLGGDLFGDFSRRRPRPRPPRPGPRPRPTSSAGFLGRLPRRRPRRPRPRLAARSSTRSLAFSPGSPFFGLLRAGALQDAGGVEEAEDAVATAGRRPTASGGRGRRRASPAPGLSLASSGL